MCCGGGQQVETIHLRGKKEIIIIMAFGIHLPVPV